MIPSGSAHSLQDVKPPDPFLPTNSGYASSWTVRVTPGRMIRQFKVGIVEIGSGPPPDSRMYKRVINRGASDDGMRGRRSMLCRELVAYVYLMSEQFGKEDLQYVYDGRETLFTNKPDGMAQDGDENNPNAPPSRKTTFTVGRRELSVYAYDILGDVSVVVSFEVVRDLDISNLNASEADSRTIRRFIDMLIGHPVVLSRDYHVLGNMGKLFEKEGPGNSGTYGILYHAGLSKGVHIVANGEGNPEIVLLAEERTAAFYQGRLLDKTVPAFADERGAVNWQRFIYVYKGVRCFLRHNPKRTVVITGLSEKPIGEMGFSVNGGQISLTEYYELQHNIEVEHADWHALTVDGQEGAAYPAEALFVLPAQRVPTQCMTDRYAAGLLRRNILDVQQRRINTRTRFDRILSEANRMLMLKFGVTIEEFPDLEIKVQRLPAIEYSGDTVEVPGDDWSVDSENHRYTDPKGHLVTRWTVLLDNAIVAKYQNGEELVKERFVKQIMAVAPRKGLHIPPPIYNYVDGKGALDAKLQELRAQEFTIVMYIDDKVEASHGLLKLYERRHSILTQHVTFKIVQRSCSDPAITMNIVHKFNCKVQGLCYVPRILPFAVRLALDGKKKIFVMGLDVCHPRPATPHQIYQLRLREVDHQSYDPCVVGITGNFAANVHSFIGDYHFQPSRRNKPIDAHILRLRTKWMLTKFYENHRQDVNEVGPPPVFIVFRHGVTEGQVQMVVNEELPEIRKGCLAWNIRYKPRIVLVVVTKQQNNERFSEKRGNNDVVGTSAGSFIDTAVVRHNTREFFLQSHAAQQGCGPQGTMKVAVKIPKYIVAVDEVKLSNEELSAFVNCLCYSHQICSQGISLPEPVYQAHELAKRGFRNYETLKQKSQNEIPRDEHSSLIDFGALTEYLSYAPTQDDTLCLTRFTA